LEFTTDKCISLFCSSRVYFYFVFEKPFELCSILQNLHSLFYPFSKTIGYCCASSPEKEALQTNLKDVGSPAHSYDHARCNLSPILRLVRLFN